MSKADSSSSSLLELAPEMMCLALSVTLYFRSARQEFQQGAIYCLEQYLARSKSFLKWYGDSDDTRYVAATDEHMRYPQQRLTNSQRPLGFFSWIMHGGKKHRSASPFWLQGLLNVDMPRYLSFIQASWPVDEFQKDPGAFVDWVASCAQQLPLVHGYAGFAFKTSHVVEVKQRYSQQLFALANRFIGVEVEDCMGTAMVAQNAIKGVNWLTLLSQPFVEKLGGLEHLRQQFSETIKLHPLSNGVLIQAGEAPRLGDRNQEEELPAYREVARVLKPIRLAQHPELGPEEKGSFGTEGTRAWLRRLDG